MENTIIILIKQLQSLGAGNLSINTLMHYHNIYLKYSYHRKTHDSKMQAYENTAEDIGCSIDTVMRAVTIFCKILQNK